MDELITTDLLRIYSKKQICKNWYNRNKEKMKQKNAEYYQLHKEEINANQKMSYHNKKNNTILNGAL